MERKDELYENAVEKELSEIWSLTEIAEEQDVGKDWSRRPESVEVACKFLEDVFDIRRIAITQCIVDRQSGGNRQVVVLKGLSDDDYMLYREKY